MSDTGLRTLVSHGDASLGHHGDGRLAPPGGAVVARGTRRRVPNQCAISSSTDIRGNGWRASHTCTPLSRFRSTSGSERASRAGDTPGRPPPPPLLRSRSPGLHRVRTAPRVPVCPKNVIWRWLRRT